MTDNSDLQPGQYAPGEHPALAPPPGTTGVVGWFRQNLFPSIGSSALTVLAILLILWVVPKALEWAVFDATTYGENRSFCIQSRQVSLLGERAANVDYGLLQSRGDASAARKDALRNLNDAARQLGAFGREYKAETVTPEFADLVVSTGAIAVAGAVDAQYKPLAAATKKSKLLLPRGANEFPEPLEDALAATDMAALQAGFAGLGPLVSYAEGNDGACWTLIKGRGYQYFFGFYPREEAWRIVLTAVLFFLALVPVLFDHVPHRKWGLIYSCFFPVFAYVLVMGGFGLAEIETEKPGGLLLTMIVSLVGIVGSLPIGIVLALGRRSEMPVIRLLCVVFIEFIRGVPLITILFMGSTMLPFFLPEGVNFDKLLRALIAVTLFSSAYMAEVVRAGLQAIPRGQYEGAMALGLGFWRMMYLIILPQALRIVIPGIVSNFIGLFKDTSLVSIIGLFDLLQVAKSAVTNTNWLALAPESYAFIAGVYFCFCFSMARYSIWLEGKLYTGHKR